MYTGWEFVGLLGISALCIGAGVVLIAIGVDILYTALV